MKYKAQINNHFEFELTSDMLQSVDMVSNGQQSFHFVEQGQSYKAKIVAADFESKTFEIIVNGRNYSVQLEDAFDRLVSELGLEIVSSHKLKDIKAPMPGLVLDIAVEPGQEVQKGDKLLILEAMKMENVIKSDGEGKVKAVHINKGLPVDKGQLLIEME